MAYVRYSKDLIGFEKIIKEKRFRNLNERRASNDSLARAFSWLSHYFAVKHNKTADSSNQIELSTSVDLQDEPARCVDMFFHELPLHANKTVYLELFINAVPNFAMVDFPKIADSPSLVRALFQACPGAVVLKEVLLKYYKVYTIFKYTTQHKAKFRAALLCTEYSEAYFQLSDIYSALYCEPDCKHLNCEFGALIGSTENVKLKRLLFFEYVIAHGELFDICFALAAKHLPPYVILEIFNWFPRSGCITEKHKIDQIVAFKKTHQRIAEDRILLLAASASSKK